jgi:hypothetical protein
MTAVGNAIGNMVSVVWAVSVALQFCLLAMLLYRRAGQRFPAFATYVVGTLLQSLTQFLIYRLWDSRSQLTLNLSWSVQGAIIVLRMLAVLELCRIVFRGYRGIWTLIWRVLTALFVAVAAAAMLFEGRKDWILHADNALGLALAAVVVGLFLIARYYRVQTREPLRTISVGFFLYSSFVMLNNTILEIWLSSYATLWNFLSVLAFTGSLLIWVWALRHPAAQYESAPQLLHPGVYRALAPEVNLRLRLLNERLSQLAGPHPGERS